MARIELSLPDELIHAARRGQVKRIVKWLKAGGCVDGRCTALTGNTLLHAAAVHEQAELMLLLLRQKASVNLQNHEGSTALMAASEQARYGTEAVRILLEQGAECNMQCDRLCTALTSAARNGRRAVLLLLIEHRADPDHHTEKLGSPLMQAAGAGHVACVKALLEARADTSVRSAGKTALDFALSRGHTEIAAMLRMAAEDGAPAGGNVHRGAVARENVAGGGDDGRVRARRGLLTCDLRSHA